MLAKGSKPTSITTAPFSLCCRCRCRWLPLPLLLPLPLGRRLGRQVLGQVAAGRPQKRHVLVEPTLLVAHARERDREAGDQILRRARNRDADGDKALLRTLHVQGEPGAPYPVHVLHQAVSLTAVSIGVRPQ